MTDENVKSSGSATSPGAEKKTADAERKAREKLEVQEKAAAERKAKEEAPYVAIAERYAGNYPDCPEFHITSDKMVFLSGDKAEAEAHQNTLGKGKLRTIKTK